MVGEVRLAGLAAVDALSIEVDVVGEAHPCWLGAGWMGHLDRVEDEAEARGAQ